MPKGRMVDTCLIVREAGASEWRQRILFLSQIFVLCKESKSACPSQNSKPAANEKLPNKAKTRIESEK